MSLEAFGDEGNVPTSIQDTEMYQELVVIRTKLSAWMMKSLKEFPNDEIKSLFADAVDALDKAGEALDEVEL